MTSMTFEDTDICRVTNEGDSTLVLGYNNRQYKINPGEKRTVPIYAAIVAFGDPRSIGSIRSWKNPNTNEVGWVPDRAAEVRRLRVRYAILDGHDGTFEDASGKIAPTVPLVKVEFMDGGDFVELPTVLDDPLGEDSIIDQSGAIDIQTLQASLEKTQRQLAMLIQAQGGDLALGSEDDIPTDDPQAAVMSKDDKTKEAKSTGK